ncbi:MAG TPA: DEAD/DEAH box helicase [Cyclobacteriaceae bacterium]|nr:DEAD/DEAH box helicase [Cyclobacteriaceae bacterium]
MTFDQLSLIEPLLKSIKAEGYDQPTPIQEQSIPIVLERRDLLGCAQTGTGKTAAFALPILQLLHNDELYKNGPSGIKALILTPTRELAIQIEDSFKVYGKLLKLRSTVVFGGVSQHAQTKALRAGVDILVATPGRLLDLMTQGFIKLASIKIFVLDEADRMLDMGFVHDVRKVIAKLPAQRQTLFFSATMPLEIQALAKGILTNPVKVSVTPVSSTAETVTQALYYAEKGEKKKLLLKLLRDDNTPSVLVFTRTKHGADRVVKDLLNSNISARAIHGNKSQNARQEALGSFKAGKTRVLVATDIAARGIDIDDLSLVINYEIPNIPETYVHRIGRTGRAGAKGHAISFADTEEKAYIRDIQKLIGRAIPLANQSPSHSSSSEAAPRHAAPRQNSAPRSDSAPRHDSTPRHDGVRPKKKRWFHRNTAR